MARDVDRGGPGKHRVVGDRLDSESVAVDERVLWSGLPALALSFGFLRASGAGATSAFTASQAVFVIAVWLSVAGVGKAWWSVTDRAERRSWATLFIGCLALAFSETYLSGYQVFVDVAGPSGLAPSRLAGVFGAFALAAGLVSMTVLPESPRLIRARRVVDAAGLTAVVFAIAYALVHHITGASPGELVNTLLSAVYIVTGITVVGAVAFNVVVTRGVRRRGWEWVLVAALGVFGGAVLLAPLWYALVRSEGVLFPEVVLATAFLCAYYLLFVAGVQRARLSDDVTRVAMPHGVAVLSRPPVASVVTATIMLIAIPVLGAVAVRAPVDSEHAVVNFTVMALVGATMVARTALDAVHNGRLRRRAGTDPLTGVSDQQTFHTRLSDSIRTFERYGEPVSVIVFDLNDFGRINTLYGSSEGDRLLREVTRSMRAVIGKRSTLGRLGGDEFAVLLEGRDQASAAGVAREMREAVHGVLTTAGLPLTAAWGVASCPKDSAGSRDLVKKAYAAQHWAKSHGKDRVVIYDPKLVGALDHVARIATAEERAELSMMLAIAVASEARHETTRFHSRNVAALCVLVAEHLGMSFENVRDVEIAALLHDIGKTGVPDKTLAKREPRSRADEALYRDHVLIGDRIVSSTPLARVAPAIRAHHERWDGKGYPDGLSATDIPVAARIIAVCNSFEGMTSGRPDRGALSHAAALQELDQNMGLAYEPDVVEALIAVIVDSYPETRSDEGGDPWSG